MSDIIDPSKLTLKDWQVPIKPTWCAGCGHRQVLNSTKSGVLNANWLPHETVVVSGIGCSSNIPHFIQGYGVHSLHGRANPVAQGIKLANPDLNVVVSGGDGDGLAIGLGGFVHAARRNFDLTYIIMDNQVYGLTVNQASPTAGLGRKTTSTPYGNIERPLNPISLAIAAGATFVARTYSKQSSHFRDIVQQAMEHKGFAFIDAMSPCVTFNKVNTYDWFDERVYKLEDTDYQPNDLNTAFVKANEWGDRVPLGVFYKVDQPTYEEMDPTIKNFGSVVKRGAHKISKETWDGILKDHM